MKIFIIQSNIVAEQLTAIFAQILLSTIHKQSFYLKDHFIVGNKFFFLASIFLFLLHY